MGLIGKLFGTDAAIRETTKTVNNVFDGVSSGIDKSFFTTEEKYDYVIKLTEMIMSTLTAGDALARRLIALFIVGYYFTGISIIGVIRCLETVPGKDQVRMSQELFNLITTEPPTYVTVILGLYFGYFGGKSLINAYKRK